MSLCHFTVYIGRHWLEQLIECRYLPFLGNLLFFLDIICISYDFIFSQVRHTYPLSHLFQHFHKHFVKVFQKSLLLKFLLLTVLEVALLRDLDDDFLCVGWIHSFADACLLP